MQADVLTFKGFSTLKSRRVALGAGSRRFKSSRPDHASPEGYAWQAMLRDT